MAHLVRPSRPALDCLERVLVGPKFGVFGGIGWVVVDVQ